MMTPIYGHRHFAGSNCIALRAKRTAIPLRHATGGYTA